MKRATAREMINTLMKTGYNNAIIFYRSPITNEVESRDMMSTSYNEVVLWAQQLEKFYKEINVSYVIYVNGEMFDSYGEPIVMEDIR